MATKKPIYVIDCDDYGTALNKDQLEEVLDALPLSIEISRGHDLSLEAKFSDSPGLPILRASHGASLIQLKPQPGMRLSDACFSGSSAAAFTPSRVMDECTGGGACCSYHFDTMDLGLPYSHSLTLDIKKLG